MFSGNLKFNLDPWAWDQVTDDRIQEVLTLLGLDLDTNAVIHDGGCNLSMGEKQLICLGRALLR